MYNNISDKIVTIGITKEYKEPLYIDRARKVFFEREIFGFKVTYNIKYPNYFIMASEVDGNILQKGNEYVRGTKLLYKKGSVPRKVVSH